MKNAKLFLKGTLLVSSLFVLSQCKPMPNSTSDNEKTFIVGPETADCTGVAPMKCLQVKEKESDSWQNFYTNIEGFTYEPGYEYVLKVKTEKIENPPMDASSIKYTLIKQVSKTKK
ncbi:DUF4377 domain-containing protein [Chryseobacterium sp. YIM B08800]|uniref:DUF4377 domain-containing protein n=1 Tax=Chryseobacterium sp. YIM B08800 TaxID=2984136 RepID=UPI00223EFB28|nr:DUF4377 domain-containing protein [Chryseobacterium sp. YIM B08800]